MIISAILAAGRNGVIGSDNKLLWKLPKDMKFFKDKTGGHCVIMGRKTFESLPDGFRPLPGRTNIVLSTNPGYIPERATIARNLNEAIMIAYARGETECFIIGGANVYEQAFNICDRIYLTFVHSKFIGDAHVKIPFEEFDTVSNEYHASDEKHAYNFAFYEMHRKQQE